MLEFKRMNSIARFAQQFEVFDRSPHQRDVPVELVADPLHLLSPTAVLVIDLKKWRSIAKTANATKVAASDQQHRPASVLAVFLGGIAGPVRAPCLHGLYILSTFVISVADRPDLAALRTRLMAEPGRWLPRPQAGPAGDDFFNRRLAPRLAARLFRNSLVPAIPEMERYAFRELFEPAHPITMSSRTTPMGDAG